MCIVEYRVFPVLGGINDRVSVWRRDLSVLGTLTFICAISFYWHLQPLPQTRSWMKFGEAYLIRFITFINSILFHAPVAIRFRHCTVVSNFLYILIYVLTAKVGSAANQCGRSQNGLQIRPCDALFACCWTGLQETNNFCWFPSPTMLRELRPFTQVCSIIG